MNELLCLYKLINELAHIQHCLKLNDLINKRVTNRWLRPTQREIFHQRKKNIQRALCTQNFSSTETAEN